MQGVRLSRPTSDAMLATSGVIAAVSFIVAFTLEGLVRPGYSPWRHAVSKLSTGEGGWVQVVNFLVSGVLVLAFAVGLWRNLPPRRSSRIAAVLVALFATALLVAGVFATDPALDYPEPTGANAAHTLHGLIHGLAGLACFSLVSAAIFALAMGVRGTAKWRGWPAALAACGVLVVVFFAGFIAASVLDGAGVLPNAPGGLLERLAIVAGWGALGAVSWRLIRQPL